MNADDYYSYPGEPRFDCACEFCIKGAAHSDEAHQASVEKEEEFKREVKRHLFRGRAANARNGYELEFYQRCLQEVDHPSEIRHPDPAWNKPWTGTLHAAVAWAAPKHNVHPFKRGA